MEARSHFETTLGSTFSARARSIFRSFAASRQEAILFARSSCSGDLVDLSCSGIVFCPMLVALRQCLVKTLSPQVNNLATSLDAVRRHPKDPDHLPATYAWRKAVQDILDASERLDLSDGNHWTRSKLAKACKTTPSQILKLLNGSVKSSPLVRKVNIVLRIFFVEPQPISEAQARIISMMLEVDDLDWLEQTVEKVAPKNH